MDNAIEAMTEAVVMLASSVQDGHDLADALEEFPDFAEVLASQLQRLAEWAREGGAGDSVAGLISGMAQQARALKAAAEQADEEFRKKNQFWLRGR